MMRRPILAATVGSRLGAPAILLLVTLSFSLVAFGVPGTGALFTADYPDDVTISAGQIFPDERISPAFSVIDRSSGSAVDVSSSVAFANDGLIQATSAWPVAFAGGRYVELRFNEPLPGSVGLTAASFDLSWATASGTACVYLEVRDQSGTLVDSQGDSGNPLSCTSSASAVDLVTPLPGVSATDAANGARVRMFVSSSTGAGTVVDRAVLKATYGAEQFTLHVVDLIDVADGTPALYHWGLAGP